MCWAASILLSNRAAGFELSTMACCWFTCRCLVTLVGIDICNILASCCPFHTVAFSHIQLNNLTRYIRAHFDFDFRVDFPLAVTVSVMVCRAVFN